MLTRLVGHHHHLFLSMTASLQSLHNRTRESHQASTLRGWQCEDQRRKGDKKAVNKCKRLGPPPPPPTSNELDFPTFSPEGPHPARRVQGEAAPPTAA